MSVEGFRGGGGSPRNRCIRKIHYCPRRGRLDQRECQLSRGLGGDKEITPVRSFGERDGRGGRKPGEKEGVLPGENDLSHGVTAMKGSTAGNTLGGEHGGD